MGGGERGMPGRNDRAARWKWASLGVCVCVSVGVETERERQTVKVCCHRRCSQLVTGITASVTASPIGQWASASDLIGSGSETDDLFLEMTGSCSAETHTSCDSSGPVPLSFCQCLIYVCVCACVRVCVWEAAVFANVFPFPPSQGWPVCESERKKERGGKKRRLNAIRRASIWNSGLPPSLYPAHSAVSLVGLTDVTGRGRFKSLHTNTELQRDFQSFHVRVTTVNWPLPNTKECGGLNKRETVRKRQREGE